MDMLLSSNAITLKVLQLSFWEVVALSIVIPSMDREPRLHFLRDQSDIEIRPQNLHAGFSNDFGNRY